MPVGQVIICGVRRGPDLIGSDEFQQFAGRAGRKAGGRAVVKVMCSEEDEPYAYGLIESKTPEVLSQMDSPEEIAFRILPLMHQGFGEDEYLSWKKRTLAYAQGRNAGIGWNSVKEVLVRHGCVDSDCNLLEAGNLSVSMYLRPDRSEEIWSRTLEVSEILRGKSESSPPVLSSEFISYMGAPTMEMPSSGIKVPEELLSVWRRRTFLSGLSSSEHEESGCLFSALFGNDDGFSPEEGFVFPKELSFLMKTIRENSDRLFSVVECSLRMAGIKADSEMTVWRKAANHKTSFPVAEMMTRLDVSKKIAEKLVSENISAKEYESRKDEILESLSEDDF